MKEGKRERRDGTQPQVPESLEAATTETKRQGTKIDVVKTSQDGTKKLGDPGVTAAANKAIKHRKRFSPRMSQKNSRRRKERTKTAN